MLQTLMLRPRMSLGEPNTFRIALPDKWRPYTVRVVVTVAEHDPLVWLLQTWREELRALEVRTEAQEERLTQLTSMLKTLSVALPEAAQ